jgi:hypothetical protein
MADRPQTPKFDLSKAVAELQRQVDTALSKSCRKAAGDFDREARSRICAGRGARQAMR